VISLQGSSVIGILTQVLTLIRPETSGKIRDIQLKVALGRNHVDFQAAMNEAHMTVKRCNIPEAPTPYAWSMIGAA